MRIVRHQAWYFWEQSRFFLVCFIFIVTFDSFPNYLSVEFPLVVYTAVQNNDDRRKLISQAIFFQF